MDRYLLTGNNAENSVAINNVGATSHFESARAREKRRANLDQGDPLAIRRAQIRKINLPTCAARRANRIKLNR